MQIDYDDVEKNQRIKEALEAIMALTEGSQIGSTLYAIHMCAYSALERPAAS